MARWCDDRFSSDIYFKDGFFLSLNLNEMKILKSLLAIASTKKYGDGIIGVVWLRNEMTG